MKSFAKEAVSVLHVHKPGHGSIKNINLGSHKTLTLDPNLPNAIDCQVENEACELAVRLQDPAASEQLAREALALFQAGIRIYALFHSC